jgi:hypothetical protein
MAAVGGPGDDAPMRTPRTVLAATLLLSSLLLGACGGDDDSSAGSATEAPAADGSGGGAERIDGDELDQVLEDAATDATREVPSEDGSVSIADYRSGAATQELPASDEIAMVISLLIGVSGGDIDGYITSDAIVVRVEEADIALLCGAADRVDLSTYTVIPVRPDGTGVDCG